MVFNSLESHEGPSYPGADPAQHGGPEDKTKRAEYPLVLLLPFLSDVPIARYLGNGAVDEDVAETCDDSACPGYRQDKDIEMIHTSNSKNRRHCE